MEQRTLKNASNCLNTNIYSYLDTSNGQNSNLYLNVFLSVLIRRLWQLKTVAFLHLCLIRSELQDFIKTISGAKVINFYLSVIYGFS
jgi:hypothetical protein